MPVIVAKLFSAKDKATLDSEIAAYQAANVNLLEFQNALAMHAVWDEAQQNSHINALICHEGLAIPASGAKTAELQYVYIEEDKLDDAQTALDAALAQVTHLTVADADTTVAGKVTTAASTPFASTDVGRIIEIGGVQKTITVFNANNDVDYDNADGDFASGSGLTLALLGAEVVQTAQLNVYKEPDQDYRFMIMLACEGELPA